MAHKKNLIKMRKEILEPVYRKREIINPKIKDNHLKKLQ